MSDWKARAEREAAAIIAEALRPARSSWPMSTRYGYDEIISLVAIGWLQGANYGSHETLRLTEDAFDELRASL